jgi:hypothetical protein
LFSCNFCHLDYQPYYPGCLFVDVITVYRKKYIDVCDSLFRVNVNFVFQIMVPNDAPLRPGSGDDSKRVLPYDCVAASLMVVLTTVLSCLAKHSPASTSSEASLERMSATNDTMSVRSNDIIR